MSRLAVIVPSRGRPESVLRVRRAWLETGAFADADLIWALDEDDPKIEEYVIACHGTGHEWVHFSANWTPMVHKLNRVAVELAATGAHEALGFAGDDHLPRTFGWAATYLDELARIRPGIVYGRDGMRPGQNFPLPTQWAMSATIVAALGAMVPAHVEHLYCDNAIRDLGQRAACLRHLPDVLIEHMHPVAGKAEMDAGYHAVNSTRRYVEDRESYRLWRTFSLGPQAELVRALRESADGYATGNASGGAAGG